jgi:hypothetical protein
MFSVGKDFRSEIQTSILRRGLSGYSHGRRVRPLKSVVACLKAYRRIRDECLGVGAVFSFRRNAKAIAMLTLLIAVNNGSSLCLHAVLIRKPLTVRNLLSISPRLLSSPREALNARSEQWSGM